MSIEFKLPEVSEGVTTVDVAEVRVKEGDVIEAGAVVCEVETDKAVAEINCPHAGQISKILIKSGDKLSVGQAILMIESSNGGQPFPHQLRNQQPAKAAAAAVPAKASTAAPAKPASSGTSSSDRFDASGPVEFKLPEVSEGVTKVDIAAVNVKAGDTIASGAVVCEVETDKAVAEINCPHAGTITAVHIKPGTSINIGAPLITINACLQQLLLYSGCCHRLSPHADSSSNRSPCSCGERSCHSAAFDSGDDSKERWATGCGRSGSSSICTQAGRQFEADQRHRCRWSHHARRCRSVRPRSNDDFGCPQCGIEAGFWHCRSGTTAGLQQVRTRRKSTDE